MLLRRSVLDRIVTGEVDLAFRRWKRPTVKTGGTLRTGVGLLEAADQAVGGLDGLSHSLASPHLLLRCIYRGRRCAATDRDTQASLDDVLAFEIEALGLVQSVDVAETVNHVKAIERGPEVDTRPWAGGAPLPRSWRVQTWPPEAGAESERPVSDLFCDKSRSAAIADVNERGPPVITEM